MGDIEILISFGVWYISQYIIQFISESLAQIQQKSQTEEINKQKKIHRKVLAVQI